MLLHDKIQELLEATKKAKAENAALVEFARTTLTAHIDAQIQSKGRQLQETLESSLEAKAQAQEIQETLKSALEAKAQQLIQEIQEPLKAQIEARALAKIPLESVKSQVAQSLAEVLQSQLEGLEATQTHSIEQKLEQAALEFKKGLEATQARALALSGAEIQGGVQTLIKSAQNQIAQEIRQALGDFEIGLKEALEKAQRTQEREIGNFLTFLSGQLRSEFYARTRLELLATMNQEIKQMATQGQAQLEGALKAQTQEIEQKVEAFVQELGRHFSDLLQADFKGVMEQTISKMDISFLQDQHDTFYQESKQKLDKLFKRELDKEFIHLVEQSVRGFLERQRPMRALKEMQLEAQLHLSALIQSHAIEVLQQEGANLMSWRKKELEFYQEVRMQELKDAMVKEGLLDPRALHHTKTYKTK
ncbi:coiled-coil domain-containing protein [Helicobacter vulpis]|uniref:hypothetical protein n=1 Tax=Helicobacter vulpis TaxID=2316076 RepID=UPI000EB25EFB|nr:hypothetical protein [Helicobacter vulpis]